MCSALLRHVVCMNLSPFTLLSAGSDKGSLNVDCVSSVISPGPALPALLFKVQHECQHFTPMPSLTFSPHLKLICL